MSSVVDPSSGTHGVHVVVPAGRFTPPLIAPITQVEICAAPPAEGSEVVAPPVSAAIAVPGKKAMLATAMTPIQRNTMLLQRMAESRIARRHAKLRCPEKDAIRTKRS